MRITFSWLIGESKYYTQKGKMPKKLKHERVRESMREKKRKREKRERVRFGALSWFG